MAKVEIRRDPTGPGDLCGPTEAAEILGVERTRIPRWRNKGIMPDPVAVLKTAPVWLRADLVKLAKEREAAK